MFRLLELALLGICLIAVGVILYGYSRVAVKRRKAAEHEDLEHDVSKFLKNDRTE